MFARLWNRIGRHSATATAAAPSSSVDVRSAMNHVPEPDPTLTKESTELFVPWFEYVQVIDVHDGDTFTAAVREAHTNRAFRFSVRILGVDCPEITGKSRNKSEIECSLIAKKHTESLVRGKMVRLSNVKADKFGGRFLANVTTTDNVNVASSLLQHRLAVPYHGEKKNPPEDWMKYHMSG